MQIMAQMEKYGHEQLAVWTDPAVGLRAFIAIHDTTLGPSLGGTRIWPYENEEAAITDALLLSRAMTNKSAAAGLSLGGGKGVIIADPRTDKTEDLFRSYGRFVDSLGGRYITTEDVGASEQDMEWISYETNHVVGRSISNGGSGSPAEVTAYGVYNAMLACAKRCWGVPSLKGRVVALQGFGAVATSLATYLLNADASLIITDIDPTARKRASALSGVRIVEPEEITGSECDIFAPCALGNVLNSDTIPKLKCSIVCGAANNQLAGVSDSDNLQRHGILYAPDFIANAGGVINVYHELNRSYNREAAMEKAAGIYDTTEQVFSISSERNISTARAAETIALERLASAGRSHR